MTDFLELAGRRYTCRKYSPKALEQGLLDKLLEAGRLAPSAKNRQPWHVWVLRSEEALSKVRRLTGSTYGAPLVLAVGFDPSQGWVRESDGKNKAEMDSIIMATHIMLEAEDLGLGCTWIGSYEPSELYETFPEMVGCEVQVLLALGYRAEDAHPGPWHPLRKPLEDIVTEL